MLEGLKRAIEIIKEEKKEAIQINPQMAFGMSHILRIIEEEMEKESDLFSDDEGIAEKCPCMKEPSINCGIKCSRCGREL